MVPKPAESEDPGAEPGRRGEPAVYCEGDAQGRPEPHREPEQADEHTGPVAIARHVKSDGRALILYTRDRPAPPA